jgi:segregation and condensation protein B
MRRAAVLPYAPRTHLKAFADRRLPLVYRLLGAPGRLSAGSGPLARDPLLAAIEAVLLAADEPLSPRKLAVAAGLSDAAEVRRLVKRLQSLYELDASAFQINEVAGGFQLLTGPEFHPWLASLRQNQDALRLSLSARETLTIIAYRQPVMRADIEAVRGVQCGDILRLLMEKGLIRIAGRHQSLGRPVLYGTTKKFLQAFGLQDLKDLPARAQPRT